MKKDRRVNKKLTRKDYDRMWGEDSPYSQVRLCEETRIMGNSVSRVFLVVEAEVNPFTFEYVQKHRQQFVDDESILQLLDHAEYRGEFGYVVSGGEVELEGEESRQFVQKQADMTTETLIRMHKFVIDECGLTPESKYGVIEDKILQNKHLVWDEESGKAEPVENELWDGKTLIGSPAGIQNNKMRFFIVLAFEKHFDFKRKYALSFAKTIKTTSASFKVEIESIESFREYVLIAALLHFDIAPASFIETLLDECVMARKKPMFKKDYFVTNVEKPTPEQIMLFLKRLPLHEDIEMSL